MSRAARAVALALVALSATAAGAATIDAFEAEARGGDFGQNHRQAALFGPGTGAVHGRQSTQGDSDYLGFTGFAAGTERVDFRFTNAGGAWGGFNLRLKEGAFSNRNDWWPLAHAETVGSVTGDRPATISYVLDGYTGPLHMAIDFFNADFRGGDGLDYSITVHGATPAPAPIPLPGGLALALAGLGALAGLAIARRRA